MSSASRRLSREDYKSIAVAQKAIILSLLCNVAAWGGLFALPDELKIVVYIVLGLIGLAGTVFVFLLAVKVYNPVVGVLLGFLVLVPCVGLLVLLIINQKASSVLDRVGYRVGFLGVNLDQFNDERLPRRYRYDDDEDDDYERPRSRRRDDDDRPRSRPRDDEDDRPRWRERDRDDDDRPRPRDGFKE